MKAHFLLIKKVVAGAIVTKVKGYSGHDTPEQFYKNLRYQCSNREDTSRKTCVVRDAT